MKELNEMELREVDGGNMAETLPILYNDQYGAYFLWLMVRGLLIDNLA